jgi:dTDP-4-amino-4,6-dideoxy-D-galactose acyltransferase
VEDWARRNTIDCVYFLARSDDPATAQVAEGAGFRLMDARMQLCLESPAGVVAAGIRESRPDDVPALAAIARASHRGTRFYADPNFPPARCDDLYAVWIERSCAGWADVVLVAELDGGPEGYVSCHLDEPEGTASIGLIAVVSSGRRKGLGRALVDSAVAWCAKRGAREIRVVTQGRSVAALRLYENCGFRLEALGLWFHRWYHRDR